MENNKDMKLKDKREEWEQGGEEVLVVTEKTFAGDYSIVYVVLDFGGEYAVQRYFPLRENWEVSVDISNSTLEKCLNHVSEAFEEHYPKEK